MVKVALAVLIFVLGLSSGYYLWALNGVGEIEHALGKPIPLPPHIISSAQEEEEAMLSESNISREIIGTWESVDDVTFTREFSADTTVTDTYVGSAPEAIEGRWAMFTSPAGEKPPFPISNGVTYLRITMPEEALYFSVTTLTETELELAYLDGNGVQKFERKNAVR